MEPISASLPCHEASFQELLELIPHPSCSGLRASCYVQKGDPSRPHKRVYNLKNPSEPDSSTPNSARIGSPKGVVSIYSVGTSRVDLQAKLRDKVAGLREGRLLRGEGMIQRKILPRAREDMLKTQQRLRQDGPAGKEYRPVVTPKRPLEFATSATQPIDQVSQQPVDNISPKPGDPTDLLFSALSFSAAPMAATRDEQTLSKRNPLRAKLALDRRAAFLAKLDPEAREKAEDKDKWQKVGKLARGDRVMDNAAKLDKAIRRQKKEKMKRAVAWSQRDRQSAIVQAAAQKKRQDNIDKRKKARTKTKSGVKNQRASVKGF